MTRAIDVIGSIIASIDGRKLPGLTVALKLDGQRKWLANAKSDEHGQFHLAVERSEFPRRIRSLRVRLHVFDGRKKVRVVDGDTTWSPPNQVPQTIVLRVNAEDLQSPEEPDDSTVVLALNSSDGRPRIQFDGDRSQGIFGGNGVSGQVFVFPSTASDFSNPDQATIRLDGAEGDILLANADCAEDFVVAAEEHPLVEPGHVMVLDDQANLTLCTQSYDRRVAGVVSGAGGYRPGIVLGRRAGAADCVPLALAGRVACRVDADLGAIAVGDPLTTSTSIGHAMKAQDRDLAFGAVIGKALQPMASGKGLIPILVALQ